MAKLFKTTALLYVALVMLALSSFYLESQIIKVGLSQNTAPQKQGNTLHFESELMRQLLTELGYKVEFIAVPHARLALKLQNKQLDIAVRQDKTTSPGIFYSQPYIEFHNLVFALADFPDQLHSIKDMSRYSVTSFQHATKILGDEFAQAMTKSSSYREVVDHNQAIEYLQQGRTQLLVLDKVTFYRRWNEKGFAEKQVQTFDLFAKTRHHLGFTDQSLQQRVSHLLAQWQRSGKVAALQLQFRQLNQSLN